MIKVYNKIYNLEEFDLNTLLLKHKNDRLIYFRPSPILLMTKMELCKITKIKTKYSEYEISVSSLDLDFFSSFDQMLIKLGKENKTSWPFDPNIKIKYKSLVDFDGNVKFKIIQSKDFNTIIFNKNGELVSSIDLSKEINARLIFEPVGIWFNDNIYGVYLRLHEIRIKDNEIKNEIKDEIKDDDDIDYILSESS